MGSLSKQCGPKTLRVVFKTSLKYWCDCFSVPFCVVVVLSPWGQKGLGFEGQLKNKQTNKKKTLFFKGWVASTWPLGGISSLLRKVADALLLAGPWGSGSWSFRLESIWVIVISRSPKASVGRSVVTPVSQDWLHKYTTIAIGVLNSCFLKIPPEWPVYQAKLNLLLIVVTDDSVDRVLK